METYEVYTLYYLGDVTASTYDEALSKAKEKARQYGWKESEVKIYLKK